MFAINNLQPYHRTLESALNGLEGWDHLLPQIWLTVRLRAISLIPHRAHLYNFEVRLAQLIKAKSDSCPYQHLR
ncbi:hypothetical protein ANCDUO_16449 [Ancylostoma duodenale]|uniref:Uncharacterized protein n=1 Tax=Ancylostoma duodenale TaxID=51022 RepID=A0A0C2G8W1_9BILA|nr:hypothetical protein ANCDUO_16449 [Ancylostoma duodenale]